MASVSVVPRCGHLVRPVLSLFGRVTLMRANSLLQAVQENPDGVADAIFHILSSSAETFQSLPMRTRL